MEYTVRVACDRCLSLPTSRGPRNPLLARDEGGGSPAAAGVTQQYLPFEKRKAKIIAFVAWLVINHVCFPRPEEGALGCWGGETGPVRMASGLVAEE